MKKYIYATLVAGAALFLVGCSDDEMEQMSIKQPGEEIAFGGRAGFEVSGDEANVKTRTVYTGNVWTEKDETGATKSYEGVNWVSGDKVRIFCKEANGTKVADYTVNATNTDAITGTEKHEVGLTKIGNVGLQWSNADEYDFYAVYPSPQQYPLTSENKVDPTYSESVLNGNTDVKGVIPGVQTYRKLVNNGGSYVLHPKMEYAYMVARHKVTNADKVAKEVYLSFVPIATAVEIELTNKSNRAIELNSILVASSDGTTPIYGSFTADLTALTDGNNDKSYTGVPDEGFITVGVNDTKGSQITIPTYTENGGSQGSPINLENGKSLKFTVFMLPNDNIDDLKITLVGVEGTRVGVTNGIEIAKHKKTYLQQMPITQKAGDFDQSRWIEFLPDNAYLKGLSIPGAGGAASGYKYDSSADETGINAYLEQSLTIESLWKQGIRCFEFTVDKVTSGSLGSSVVICNNQNTNKTLDYCIGEVTRLLAANPKEFAMVIITYQQSSGWNERQTDGSVNQTRDPVAFMSQLNTYWSSLTLPASSDENITLQKALYNTDLTVETARGKLFCIARPTSNGEDNFATITTENWKPGWVTYNRIASTTYPTTIATPTVTDPTILVVHGWGALKDKWYARGFTECIYHRGNGWGDFRNGLAVDQCRVAMGWNASRPGRPFDTASKSNDPFTTLGGTDYYSGNGGKNFYPASITKTQDVGLTSNFYYSTVTSSGTLQSNAAWVQEWARVSPETKTYTIASQKYVRWLESMTEKKQHVNECLNYALKKEKGNIIYINSLCGYYITDAVPKSIYPNSLTDYNISYEKTTLTSYKYVKPATLSTMSSDAGMCGDIATFAKDMNNYFYDLLLKTTDSESYVAGPMGIILMDRVSADKTTTGSKIPSIIIANNFQTSQVTPAPATVSEIKKTETAFDPNNETPLAKPRNSEGGMTITWE